MTRTFPMKLVHKKGGEGADGLVCFRTVDGPASTSVLLSFRGVVRPMSSDCFLRGFPLADYWLSDQLQENIDSRCPHWMAVKSLKCGIVQCRSAMSALPAWHSVSLKVPFARARLPTEAKLFSVWLICIETKPKQTWKVLGRVHGHGVAGRRVAQNKCELFGGCVGQNKSVDALADVLWLQRFMK